MITSGKAILVDTLQNNAVNIYSVKMTDYGRFGKTLSRPMFLGSLRNLLVNDYRLCDEVVAPLPVLVPLGEELGKVRVTKGDDEKTRSVAKFNFDPLGWDLPQTHFDVEVINAKAILKWTPLVQGEIYWLQRDTFVSVDEVIGNHPATTFIRPWKKANQLFTIGFPERPRLLEESQLMVVPA